MKCTDFQLKGAIEGLLDLPSRLCLALKISAILLTVSAEIENNENQEPDIKAKSATEFAMMKTSPKPILTISTVCVNIGNLVYYEY